MGSSSSFANEMTAGLTAAVKPEVAEQDKVRRSSEITDKDGSSLNQIHTPEESMLRRFKRKFADDGTKEQSSTADSSQQSSCSLTTLDESLIEEVPEVSEDPPDGGYGWVCCLCVTLIMFSTWGANSGFGVFLAYYFNNGVFQGANKYSYALVAGITVACGQGFAPFAMFLTKIFGCKVPMYMGVVMLFCGFMLASFAKELWQLYLTQGVLVGVSMALLYAPATTVIPGWFLKRRSLAIGLSLIGTGAGGVTYSVSVNKLIQDSGNQSWALRMMAVSCTITCIVATVLIKPRNPPKPVYFKSWSGVVKEFKSIFSLRVARMYSVNLVAVWFVFALFGYNLMVFTLSPYAVAKGLSAHQASILTTCLNAAQTVGRPIMGYLGDKFGRINTTALLTTVLSTLVFAFWIPCHTFIQLLMFSICTGSCVGVGNVMSTVLVADVVNPTDFLAAWGLVNSMGAPFLLECEIVAQALTDSKNPNNPYLHAQVFTGVCFVCALILMLVFRESRVRTFLQEQFEILSNPQRRVSAHLEQKRNDTIFFQETPHKSAEILAANPKNFFRRMFYPIRI
ncbi:LAQU0S12e00166g1_1 [Lachancea quebecensis]|uniref:LAQU0S12e00166g1_1 n=1 Tax=Lachancea quebecensis TaxID=1654605 RepID=A0A0P1KU68_9SACH|nr:LAQU0S12e00166g1_1 [Lachancea quebecensis]